jgi:hypothetical protein
MRSLLATPVALLALVGVPGQTYPITGSEAAAVITARIHRQVHHRLQAGFSGETHCSGTEVGQGEVTATTQLAHWRCTLELRGRRFPTPCKAAANVFATSRPSHPRLQWLYETKSCHEGRAHRHLSNRRS